MIKLNNSFKSLPIDQSDKRTLTIVAIASAVTIFSLFSAKALLSQASYHRRELGAKRLALQQLQANVKIADSLQTQYQTFNTTNPNIIGGKNLTDPNATPPDGDNARVVLDALPSKYDFPALISSLAKILSNNGIGSPGIAGSDMAATIDNSSQVNPSPQPISLSLSGVSSYANAQSLIKDLERSIRPFDITSLQLGGNASSVSISAGLNTYFQPAKVLKTDAKEVK